MTQILHKHTRLNWRVQVQTDLFHNHAQVKTTTYIAFKLERHWKIAVIAFTFMASCDTSWCAKLLNQSVGPCGKVRLIHLHENNQLTGTCDRIRSPLSTLACCHCWNYSCCSWWWDHTGFYLPVYSTRTVMILRPTLKMSSNFRSSSSSEWRQPAYTCHHCLFPQLHWAPRTTVWCRVLPVGQLPSS